MKELLVLIKEHYMNRVFLQGEVILYDDGLLNIDQVKRVDMSTSEKHVTELIKTLVGKKYVIDSEYESEGYSTIKLINISRLNLVDIIVTTDNLPRPSSIEVIRERVGSVEFRELIETISENLHNSSVPLTDRDTILEIVGNELKADVNLDKLVSSEEERTIYNKSKEFIDKYNLPSINAEGDVIVSKSTLNDMLNEFLEQETKAIKLDSDIMLQSLVDITEPIKYLRRRSDMEDTELNSRMIIKFTEDVMLYQDIARGALRKINK